MNDNVVHLKPPSPRLARSRLVALSAAALAAAEMDRRLCIEAAAEMTDTLRDRIATAHPAMISRETVAECLANLAQHIRSLKADELTDPPGDAA
jgi:hypothetical protein